MKKLNGMKKGFSSLENKRLKNLHAILGGEETNHTWTDATCENNTPDSKCYKDGVEVKCPVPTTHLAEIYP